jgi:hypothetical protein
MRTNEIEELSLPELQGLVTSASELERILGQVGSSLRRRVLRYGKAFERIAPGFNQRFVIPFKEIKRIEFKEITSGAAFEIEDGFMTMNTGHIRGLLLEIVTDVDNSPHQLQESEIGRLVRLAIELFILHEVRHLSQGVDEYESVQKLKIIAEKLVGQFDLIADRDAAHAYALLRGAEKKKSNFGDYIRHFGEALFFMGQFCFPAFKTPLNKPHKVARALGLTMMLARIALAQTLGYDAKRANSMPLDTALMPEIAPDWAKITIFAFNPDLHLVAIAVEVDPIMLESICERLDDGNFEYLLVDVIKLIRSFPLP